MIVGDLFGLHRQVDAATLERSDGRRFTGQDQGAAFGCRLRALPGKVFQQSARGDLQRCSGFHLGEIGLDRAAGGEHDHGVSQRPRQDHQEPDDRPLLQLEAVGALVQVLGLDVVVIGLRTELPGQVAILFLDLVACRAADDLVPGVGLVLEVLRSFSAPFGGIRQPVGVATHPVFPGLGKMTSRDGYHGRGQPRRQPQSHIESRPVNPVGSARPGGRRACRAGRMPPA
ncbi:hypothetical protein [Nocardia miyunensis]|uniref:hypothetical protein n=1 Tax=Nocardia miyunensis TaxID=282684 RepID=UPI001471F947|nr:hypothetical protein [Nocardia miyunensis]